tara:strand:+ start:374 stop:682 length:309 start_codon:yes stop_codon:yes gene_type:complete
MAKSNYLRFTKDVTSEDKPWDILKDKRGPKLTNISGDPRVSTDLVAHWDKFREDDLDLILAQENISIIRLNLPDTPRPRERWLNQLAQHKNGKVTVKLEDDD